MKLFELRLRPTTAWRTPWSADTLFGLLCWACAREYGSQILDQEIIQPSLSGFPPFVLSDAFPRGWMPAPAILRESGALASYRKCHATDRAGAVKRVRKGRWITDRGFRAVQQGSLPALEEFAMRDPIKHFVEINNQIGRNSSTTSDGGQLYHSSSMALRDVCDELIVYVRTTHDYSSRVYDLFQLLSETGFGADVTTGRGEFEVVGELESCSKFESIPDPNASIVISTFQPKNGDPIDGVWDARIKYGKVGPDFGLGNVFKRPIVLLKPGATFFEHKKWFGRAIRMRELLEESVATHLQSINIGLIHPAFGLALSARLGSIESEPPLASGQSNVQEPTLT